MNNLSWLIYLAEVIPNVTSLAMLLSVLSAIVFLVYAGVGSLNSSDTFSWDSQETKDRKYSWWSKKKYLPPRWFVVTLLSTWVIVSLVPSKQTIYLIAGSEAAETVVTSEMGQEVLSDIQQIIKHQLGQLKGETK